MPVSNDIKDEGDDMIPKSREGPAPPDTNRVWAEPAYIHTPRSDNQEVNLAIVFEKKAPR